MHSDLLGFEHVAALVGLCIVGSLQSHDGSSCRCCKAWMTCCSARSCRCMQKRGTTAEAVPQQAC